MQQYNVFEALHKEDKQKYNYIHSYSSACRPSLERRIFIRLSILQNEFNIKCGEFRKTLTWAIILCQKALMLCGELVKTRLFNTTGKSNME